MVYLGLITTNNDKESKRYHYRTQVEKGRNAAKQQVKQVTRSIVRATALIAAMLSPMVVLLGLPGLTEDWYVKLGPDGTIVLVKQDPALLTTALAISFVFACFGTFAFVWRLVDKNTRFWTFSIITCYSMHSLLSIICLTTFALKSAKPNGYLISTAFFLTTSSAALAFFDILLLVLHGYFTNWRFTAAVSAKQRSMILAFMIFLVVIMIGTIAFKYLIALTFLDAIYFVIQTVITTGLGDIVPTNTAGRIFAIVYNTFGILSFATIVLFIRSTALETMESTYKSREKILLNRVKTKGFRKTLTAVFESNVDTNDREEGESISEMNYEEAVIELKDERSREFRSQLFVSVTLFFFVWLIGSLTFSQLEGWSYFISFYFCYISFSSIGYGDYYPKTPAGRAFFCAWSLIGAGTISVLFSVISEAYSSRFRETTQHQWFKKILSRIPFIPTSFTEKDIERAELEAHKPLSENQKNSNGSGKEKQDQLLELDRGKTLSLTASTSSPPNYQSNRKDKLGEVLLDLIEDVKEHVTQLIHSDGATGTTLAIEEVIKKVMDEQNFSIKNRELINSDDDLKRFIYLRRLDEKLTKLQETAKKALAEEEEEADSGISSSTAVKAGDKSIQDAKQQVKEDRDEINESK